MKHTNEIAKARKQLTKSAFSAALAGIETITEARRLAKIHKRKRATIEATAQLMFSTSNEINRLRIVARRKKPGRGWKSTETPSLRQRLDNWRRLKVRRSVRACLRSYARQSDTCVRVSDTFAGCGVSFRKDTGWINYKSHGYRMGVTDTQYTVTVYRGWLVLPGWLSECDGILTTAAIRCEADEQPGETVYRARWVINSQGDVSNKTGYIVRQIHDGWEYTAHGKTLGGARGSITRQLPEYVAAENERQRKRAEKIERLKQQIAKKLETGKLNGYNVPVTFADSRRAGNCTDGTRHWAENHFPGRESASVSELLAVPDQHDRVLLACVAAVRRQCNVP